MAEQTTVEEALTDAECKAAFLKLWADGAGHVPFVPERRAFDGLSDICEAIQDLVRNARRSLDVDALSKPLKRTPR
jgi:hypothetical protein